MLHNKLLTRDGIQRNNINDMAELMILFFTKSTEIIEVMLVGVFRHPSQFEVFVINLLIIFTLYDMIFPEHKIVMCNMSIQIIQ